MNERIKQMAEQADNFADDKIQMPGEYHPDWHDVRDEKFAELIVQECMEQASIGNGHGNNQWDRALTFAAKNIKEHFGVKE